MSVLLAEATVKVGTDVSRVGRDAEAGLKKQGGVFSRIGEITGGILGADLVRSASRAIRSVFTMGLNEAKDASAGSAQLAAGIKSTGNAAKTSVKQLMDRAGAIQAMSGQTDDSIVAAQGLLLTFTKINNAGPDKIFDRATLAAANMAARMGGDAASNAMLLGKALNDPATGIAKLTKVGVTFTEQQKAQVKAMVAAGDAAGAQKIILGELETQFGGSAEAAGKSLPGMLARIKRGFEDVTQAVAERFLPRVMPALEWLADKATTAGDETNKILDALEKRFGDIDLSGILQTAGAFSPLLLLLDELKPLLPEIATAIGDAVVELAPSIGELLVAILPLVPMLVDLGLKALPVVVDILKVAVPIFGDIIKYTLSFFDAIGNVFKLLDGSISLKELQKRLRETTGPFGDIIRFANDTGQRLSDFFQGALKNGQKFASGIGGFFKGVGKVVGDTFSNIVNFVKGGINNVISLVNTGIKALNKFKVTLPAALGGATIGLNIPRIPMLARGSRNAPDTFIAGEAGPELITGARGARVYSNAETRAMLGDGGGGDTFNITQYLDLASVATIDELIQILAALRQAARAGRGSSATVRG